jgi:hypothetical protein
MIATARSIAKHIVPMKVRDFLRPYFDEDARDARFRELDRSLSRQVFDQTGGRVVGGPFKNIQYLDGNLAGSFLCPKLLGTYEMELHPLVEGIIAHPYKSIVNIGAGEGYYAVGLARRMPGARLICYEMAERNREMLQKIAALNSVEAQIELNGLCCPDALSQRLRGQSDILVLCDVEGAEYDLLDPFSIPELRAADILVELHDMFRPGVTQELKRRFSPTHKIELLHTTPRTHADFPPQVNLPFSKRKAAMNEDRGGTMYWYWMQALPPTSP